MATAGDGPLAMFDARQLYSLPSSSTAATIVSDPMVVDSLPFIMVDTNSAGKIRVVVDVRRCHERVAGGRVSAAVHFKVIVELAIASTV